MTGNPLITRWAVSWAALAIALGLHVADEALTGFLPRYNAVVRSLRESYAWFPLPTFTFAEWLGGLIVLVLVLLALIPLVLRGYAWLRYVSFLLGILMIANAVGHITISLLIGDFAPGVYSSPILFVAAVALLVTSIRAREADPGDARP